jgi:hypothetical protein
MKVPAILKNKYVCYALMALASLNVIGYLTVKAWECLALFTLTAYSCYCYCNNVSCSILAALFVANFVFGCGRVKEGFEDAMKGPVEKMTEASGLLREAADECKVKEGGTNSKCITYKTEDACTADDPDVSDPANVCKWVAAAVDQAAAAVDQAAMTQELCEKANKTWTPGVGGDAGTCA